MGRSSIKGYVGTSFWAKHWLTLDPCGLFCITLSHTILIFAICEVYTKFISHDIVAKTIFYGFYAPFTVLALWSLFMAWTSNPGAVPMGARPVREETEKNSDVESGRHSKSKRGIRRCRKCNDNFKPLRAHHDSITGRCVVKLDHFCPWVCNAVGVLNHKFFFLFVLYTVLTCTTCLILMFTRFVRCGAQITSQGGTNDDKSYSIFVQYFNQTYIEQISFSNSDCKSIFSTSVLILFILTLLFLTFTSCMIFEQIAAIKSNVSKIARMKMRRKDTSGEELQRVSNQFNEIFGGESRKFAWHWALPLPIRFPEGMHDLVMGYEWEPSYGDEPYRPSQATNSLTPEPKLSVKVEDVTTVKETKSSEEGCISLLESPKSISNPVENGDAGVDTAPLLRSDSGMKRRNVKQDEEHVSLLNGKNESAPSEAE